MELKIGQEAEWPAAGNICLSHRTNTEEVTMLQDSPTVGGARGELGRRGEGGFQIFSLGPGQGLTPAHPRPWGSSPNIQHTRTHMQTRDRV